MRWGVAMRHYLTNRAGMMLGYRTFFNYSLKEIKEECAVLKEN
jgi:hypothetical protein